MSEHKIHGGVYIVLFLIWGIISLMSLYKIIEGIVQDNHDPLYVIITSINALVFIILGISYICNKLSKCKKKEETPNSDNEKV